LLGPTSQNLCSSSLLQKQHLNHEKNSSRDHCVADNTSDSDAETKGFWSDIASSALTVDPFDPSPSICVLNNVPTVRWSRDCTEDCDKGEARHGQSTLSRVPDVGHRAALNHTHRGVRTRIGLEITRRPSSRIKLTNENRADASEQARKESANDGSLDILGEGKHQEDKDEQSISRQVNLHGVIVKVSGPAQPDLGSSGAVS
jgi:hypothetical protein